MEPVLGIDFGTTNTVGAYVDAGGKLEVVPIRDKVSVLPTVVWFGGQGKHRVVGHLAQQQVIDDPRNTVFGFKRFIGRAFTSPFVQRHQARFLYEMVEAQDKGVAVLVYQVKRPLAEIAAVVMAELIEHANRKLGQPFTQCVMTVPAHFGYSQREALRSAVQAQGLTVKAMVNEPTAAAIYYAQKRKRHGVVLVFDLGGGTFDATLMRIHPAVDRTGSTVEVLATGGDSFLGGTDFDAALVDALAQRFEAEQNLNLRDSRVVMQRLTFAAERAKRHLSSETEVEVRVPFVGQKDGRMLDLKYSVTRDALERFTAPLVERCMSICDELMVRSGLTGPDLAEVVMVGGQTRMPAVQQRLMTAFGAQPSRDVHPELGVAAGAALLGRGVGGLLDVVPMPIHVMTPSLGSKELIPANIPVPCTHVTPLPSRPARGQPLVLSFFEAPNATSLEREEIGIARVPFSWLETNPGALSLEASMDADFRLQLSVMAGRQRLPLNLSVRLRGQAGLPASWGGAGDIVM